MKKAVLPDPLQPSWDDAVRDSRLSSREAEDRAEESEAEATAPHLLTAEEAAAWLGFSRTTVYELISAGKIWCVHEGRIMRIPIEALEEYRAALVAKGRSQV